jgi:hypothetical protein
MDQHWQTKDYRFFLKENNNGYWFAKLEIYSHQFDYWTEITIRNRPFKTKQAATNFVNIFSAGFAYRHNVQWNYDITGKAA